MTQEWKAFFKSPEFPDGQEIHAEFSEDEWSTLVEFNRYAIDLIRILPDEVPLNLNFKWDKQGLFFSSTIPNDTIISAILHNIRPFILEKENTYFRKVTSIISKNINNEGIRLLSKHMNNKFSLIIANQLFSAKINNFTLISDDFFMKWINAYEYHRDKEKIALINTLDSVLPTEIIINMMKFYIFEKVKAILDLNKLIEFVLGKSKNLEFSDD